MAGLYIIQEMYELLRVFLRLEIKNFHLDFRFQITLGFFYFFFFFKPKICKCLTKVIFTLQIDKQTTPNLAVHVIFDHSAVCM